MALEFQLLTKKILGYKKRAEGMFFSSWVGGATYGVCACPYL